MTSFEVAVGSVSSSTVGVTSRITGTVARLAVAESVDFVGATFFPSLSTSSDGIHRMEATGLDADSEYFYAVEDDGTLDAGNYGRFRTHGIVGTSYSHTVALIGDAGQGPPEYPGSGSEMAPSRVSDHPCFTDVQNYRPTLQVHVGDVTYYDPGSGVWTPDASLSTYRTMWTDVFNQSRQRDLYRNTPTEYVWDDHDFGPNDSDGTHVGKSNAAQAARERWPHYAMPEPSGAIYRAWQIGRIQYVLLDTRYYRTPNVTPDGPGKTLLGSAQKAWLQNLLQTSTSEVLVLISPTPWVGAVGGDTWSGFLTDRAEVGAMLVSTQWADRMVFATGDIHKIGVGSGAGTPDGGFPIINTGAIDADFSADARSELDLFHQGGRNQWSSIEVTDTGDQIVLRLVCWVGSVEVFDHELTFDTGTAPPEPPPAPPAAIAVPVIRSAILWQGFHRVTGQLMADLPDITGAGERQLSDYVTASQVEIPLTRGGPGSIPVPIIEQCTDGMTGSLVAVVNDVPLWMGLTGKRMGGSGPKLRLTAATPESYFLKRRVRDHVFVEVDRATVAQALVEDAMAWDGVGPGLGFELDVELTGELMTREYKATDKTTVYDALAALCAEGLEYEVYFDWADATRTRILKIVRIRRRIGRVSGTPAAMFETGDAGSVVSYDLDESWTEGDWANHVTAIGPGQGDDQPTSAPAMAASQFANGVPVIESVISPGNNITEVADLQAHADAELMRVQNGTTVLSIQAQLNAYPRLGFDVQLGDQVSFRLNGPRHPDVPFEGTRRVTGWVLNTQRQIWTPRLIDDPGVS